MSVTLTMFTPLLEPCGKDSKPIHKAHIINRPNTVDTAKQSTAR